MNFKYHFLICYFIFFIFGCNNKSKDLSNTIPIDCENEGYVNIQLWRKEIIELDSIFLNNDVFINNSLTYYRKIFGNEITKYDVSFEDVACYGQETNAKKTRYIFKGAIVDETNNVAIINIIDFKESTNIIDFNGIQLKTNTNIEDVCKVFPQSCRLIQMNGNLWSGFIEIKVNKSRLDHRRIFLIFQNEKLVKLKLVYLGR